MIPILTASEIIDLEHRSIVEWGISPLVLQENAALGALNMIPNEAVINILAGPGNNGGDALALARLAKCRGHSVNVWTLIRKPIWSGSAAIQARLWEGMNGTYCYSDEPQKDIISFEDWFVDGLFGLGIKLPIKGLAKKWIEATHKINDTKKKINILSLDLPSGLNPNSADVDNKLIIKANYTACFGYFKICHMLRPASLYCGFTKLIPIPLRDKPKAEIKVLVKPDSFSIYLSNKWNTNKRDFGHLCIRAGSNDMSGAAVLAALGALQMGVGLVTIMADPCIQSRIAAQIPEAIVRPWNGKLPENIDALLVGPGGVDEIPDWNGPLILDASALLNGFGSRWMLRHQTIITPHEGEFSRLFRKNLYSTCDRLNAVKIFANAPGLMVLKGAQSIIVGGKDRDILVNTTGHSGLSTGGSGDFLAGMIGAQFTKWSSYCNHNYSDDSLKLLKKAVGAAVWLHGASADRLGKRPILIRELGPSLGVLLSEFRYDVKY